VFAGADETLISGVWKPRDNDSNRSTSSAFSPQGERQTFVMRDLTGPDGKPILPPHNSLVEQAIIGAILSRNALLEACPGLDPDHFFEPLHRDLFGLISGMIRHGRKADPLTLNSALSEKVVAPNGMTAAQHVARCAAEGVLTLIPEHVQNYAHEVIELSWKRDLKACFEDAVDLMAKGHPDDFLSALRAVATTIDGRPVAAKGADGFLAFWHGDVATAESRPWLVYGTIPATGCGLLSGQWGTYKTFTAIDLACAVMSGTPIFDSEIDRPGGALLYAAEGEVEVPIRLQVSIENRCPSLAEPGRAPFTWLTPEKFPLKLLDPASVKAFCVRAKAIGDEMIKRFGVPLVLIEIDTVVATAGYKKSGDEDDAVLGAQMIEALKEISRQTGAFVLGVDHFGKSSETGTRGTSAKESGVDVVLATLGDRSLAGVVTNPRLAVRKVRGGVVGREYAFTTAVANTDTVDERGRSVTTLKVIWSAQPAEPVTKDKKDPWAKPLRLLRKVLTALIGCGKDIRPYPDGPMVRAIDKELVRKEFYKEYPADGDTAQKKQLARNKAFNRSITDAKTANLIGVREIEDIQYVWIA
jgi:AAA domain/DnaB-like helicase N terminal domain